MTEREIANLKQKLAEKDKQIDFLKYLVKQRETEIKQLYLLLYVKIRKIIGRK